MPSGLGGLGPPAVAEDEEQDEDPPCVSESESALRLWRLTSWLFSSSVSWSFRSDCLGRGSVVVLAVSFVGVEGFSGAEGVRRWTVRGLATGEGWGSKFREWRGLGTGGWRSAVSSAGVFALTWDGDFVGVRGLRTSPLGSRMCWSCPSWLCGCEGAGGGAQSKTYSKSPLSSLESPFSSFVHFSWRAPPLGFGMYLSSPSWLCGCEGGGGTQSKMYSKSSESSLESPFSPVPFFWMEKK